jgi:eukaryotic-like serine/threonine-protein kinase
MSQNESILNKRYVLKSQLGAGGMAVIYRAEDLELRRAVAVKILRQSLTTNADLLARFKNEARSIANMSHPNIVTVYDVGMSAVDGKQPLHYIVMEFVEGQDLKKIIRAAGKLSMEATLNYAIQICAGIGHAHRAQIVHADIKPQNILVKTDNAVKVTDFGIAQAFSTQAITTEKQAVVWGSPHYFSPEQARGDKPTPASDVYSIGIVLFEMLTGQYPYEGANQQELALAHIQKPIPRVTDINPAIKPSLSEIVHKTMSKEPNQRYLTANQLMTVLEGYRDRELLGKRVPQVISEPPPAASQSAYVPPPAVERAPTQRVDLAPVAPGSFPQGQLQYNQSGVSIPPPPQPQQQYPTYPASPQSGNSGAYYSQGYYSQPRDDSGLLDPVTIALGAIAFVAVACLIPLFIAVFQARFGG